NFALAYVGLADYYGVMANFGQMPPKEAWRKSEEAASKAAAIDDTLAEAHRALGAVKIWYDWNWQGAEQEFKRALQLNPKIYAFYARLLEMTGRIDEAIAYIKNEDELDQHHVQLAMLYYEAGRYNEAIEEWQKALEENPKPWAQDGHLGLGQV